jgi:hypothetical protein
MKRFREDAWSSRRESDRLSRKPAAALLAALCLSPAIAAGTPTAGRGLEIARRALQANEGFRGEYAEGQMETVDDGGARVVLTVKMKTKEAALDGERSTIGFYGGPEIDGTRVLTISHRAGDADQWLYVPALNRIRRVRGVQQAAPIAGSELTFEDLVSPELDKFTYRFMGEETVQGRRTLRVQRVAAARHSAYSQEVVFFDAQHRQPVRIDYYGQDGALLKTASLSDYRLVERWWRPFEVRIFNHRTRRWSILLWHKRELDKHYTQSDFDRVTLARWVLTNAIEP